MKGLKQICNYLLELFSHASIFRVVLLTHFTLIILSNKSVTITSLEDEKPIQT